MKILILRKRTVDWETFTYEKYWNQNFDRFANPKFREVFLKQMKYWDDTYDMPYFKFRSELKKIAEAHLESMEGVVVCDDIEAVKDVSGDFWLTFIDDDDWFSPKMPETLRNMSTDVPGYHWPFWRLEEKDYKLFNRFGPESDRIGVNLKCYSNNHALTRRTVEEHDYRIELERHLWVNRYIMTEKSTEPISSKLDHIGTTTNLWKRPKWEYNLPRDSFSYFNELPEWLQPLIKQLYELYGSINLRRKSIKLA